MTPVDVVVVGAGLMGAAAARSLARRGRSVVVVEQYTPGHPHGSSHGPARIVRRAYSDALYVQLTGAAFAQWAELEAASGTALIRWLGGIDFGPTRDVPRIAGHLATAGVPHEVLSARAAEERWPGMRFEGEVLFHPEAGTVDADAAAAAMLRLAEADGADVQTATVVRALTPAGDHVRLALGDGTT
ncbi:MAG: FAD-dependent oxidoreductase, partial [Jatrophihabitans sp.]|uniref:FAD-dependent oxidoreductase n=1 Tax=Jatrophihabitans sp. TaxID=1932789 RepID=UPI003F7D63C6